MFKIIIPSQNGTPLFQQPITDCWTCDA